MLRVLHVLEAIEGGTARHVVDLVRYATGVEHEVAIPRERRGGETDRLAAGAMAAAGARVHYVELRRDPVRFANAAGVAKLARLIHARRPHVVHAHSSVGGLVGRIAGAFCRTPRVYTPHGVTDIRSGVVAERVLGRITQRFIAVSPSERDHVLSLRLVTSDRLSTIVNGIEPHLPRHAGQPPDLRARFELAADAPIVGSVSRLVAQKAPEDLVAAWSHVASARPDVHFILIGAGVLQDRFDKAVDRLRLRDRVHQIRDLPGAPAVLDQFSVFTLASRFEGAPYSLLEAMRAGCPVAATDVVGTRDVIVPGVTGVLAPAGRPEALGRKIVHLLDDPGTASRLAVAAEDRVRREFGVARMGADTAALYEEVAGR